MTSFDVIGSSIGGSFRRRFCRRLGCRHLSHHRHQQRRNREQSAVGAARKSAADGAGDASIRASSIATVNGDHAMILDALPRGTDGAISVAAARGQ